MYKARKEVGDRPIALVDFERGVSYMTADGVHSPESAKPEYAPAFDKPSFLSPWELEGSHLARRDDLFRLAELGIELSTGMQFMVDWTAPGAPRGCAEDESMQSCRDHIAMLKRGRYCGSKSRIISFFYTVRGLKFHETINYDWWIAEFLRRKRKLR